MPPAPASTARPPPAGKIAAGKLAQAFMYGAKVDANRRQLRRRARPRSAKSANAQPIAIVNSINPYRIEGQKTAAFEIIDVLGRAPDFHILPVGNAGNITAYWKGYREFHALRKSTNYPV